MLEFEATPRIGGTTPIWDIPYPSSTDPVAAGAADMQALAEAVEAALDRREKLLADTGPIAAAAATIVLDQIPQTHRHLRLVCSLSATSAAAWFSIGVNGDTTAANYLGGLGTPSALGVTVGQAGAAAADLASQFVPILLDLLDPFAADRWKAIAVGGPDAPPAYWKSLAGVTMLSIKINTGNLAAGSRLRLYGKDAL